MNITFESILNFLCSFITKISTKVGSFAYFILSACSYKFLDLEGKIYAVNINRNINTADDSAVDDYASNRGLTRKQATVGIAKGKFNVEIPTGSRFQINEVVWVSGNLIESRDGYYYYVMTSEQTGSQVNKAVGQLTPITFIEGLTYAYIEEITIPAEDIESTDSLRERYKESFNSKSFSGNKVAYKEFVEAIDGVSGCKVYPLKYGNGTVGLTIIDSTYGVPSSELVDLVQNAIDPDKTGDGEGMAPIGAIVTVMGVSHQNIKIGVKCQFESGSFADWETEIRNIINNYFLEKNKTWANESEVVIRKAELISEIIKSDKIIDVTELLINDIDSNLILSTDKIAYLNELVEIA